MTRRKTIEGFPGYEVTDDGRVWSSKTNRWLKLHTNKAGYCTVGLCRENKTHTQYVHALVGEAFVGKRTKEEVFDHINENKQDNRVENLRILTRGNNVKVWAVGNPKRKSQENGTSKLNEYKVRMVKSFLRGGTRDPLIAKLFTVDRVTISDIKRGKSWKWVV
jgi:hypothetical protein